MFGVLLLVGGQGQPGGLYRWVRPVCFDDFPNGMDEPLLLLWSTAAEVEDPDETDLVRRVLADHPQVERVLDLIDEGAVKMIGAYPNDAGGLNGVLKLR